MGGLQMKFEPNQLHADLDKVFLSKRELILLCQKCLKFKSDDFISFENQFQAHILSLKRQQQQSQLAKLTKNEKYSLSFILIQCLKKYGSQACLSYFNENKTTGIEEQEKQHYQALGAKLTMDRQSKINLQNFNYELMDSEYEQQEIEKERLKQEIKNNIIQANNFSSSTSKLLQYISQLDKIVKQIQTKINSQNQVYQKTLQQKDKQEILPKLSMQKFISEGSKLNQTTFNEILKQLQEIQTNQVTNIKDRSEDYKSQIEQLIVKLKKFILNTDLKINKGEVANLDFNAIKDINEVQKELVNLFESINQFKASDAHIKTDNQQSNEKIQNDIQQQIDKQLITISQQFLSNVNQTLGTENNQNTEEDKQLNQKLLQSISQNTQQIQAQEPEEKQFHVQNNQLYKAQFNGTQKTRCSIQQEEQEMNTQQIQRDLLKSTENQSQYQSLIKKVTGVKLQINPKNEQKNNQYQEELQEQMIYNYHDENFYNLEEQAAIQEDIKPNESIYQQEIMQTEIVSQETMKQETKPYEVICQKGIIPQIEIEKDQIQQEIITEEIKLQEKKQERSVQQELMTNELVQQEIKPQEIIYMEINQKEIIPQETIPQEIKLKEIVQEDLIPQGIMQQEIMPEELVQIQSYPQKSNWQQQIQQKDSQKAETKPLQQDLMQKQNIIEKQIESIGDKKESYQFKNQKLESKQSKNSQNLLIPELKNQEENQIEINNSQNENKETQNENQTQLKSDNLIRVFNKNLSQSKTMKLSETNQSGNEFQNQIQSWKLSIDGHNQEKSQSSEQKFQYFQKLSDSSQKIEQTQQPQQQQQQQEVIKQSSQKEQLNQDQYSFQKDLFQQSQAQGQDQNFEQQNQQEIQKVSSKNLQIQKSNQFIQQQFPETVPFTSQTFFMERDSRVRTQNLLDLAGEQYGFKNSASSQGKAPSSQEQKRNSEITNTSKLSIESEKLKQDYLQEYIEQKTQQGPKMQQEKSNLLSYSKTAYLPDGKVKVHFQKKEEPNKQNEQKYSLLPDVKE